MNAHSFTMSTAIPATAPVAAKIEAHKAALEESARLWKIADDIEATAAIPAPRVQYATERHYERGRREMIETPVYAYSVPDLESNMRSMDLSGMSVFPPKVQEQIRAKHEARLSCLRAELERQFAEARKQEKECGLTSAIRAAEKVSNQTAARLDDLLRHDFITAEEVRLVAAHLVNGLDHEEGITNETIMAFVETLAARAA